MVLLELFVKVLLLKIEPIFDKVFQFVVVRVHKAMHFATKTFEIGFLCIKLH